MPAGASSNLLRSAFAVETTPGTIIATPGFKNLHVAASFTDEVQRFHQPTLIANGRPIGDAMLNRVVSGKINKAPMVYTLYDPILESLLQSTFSANVMTDGIAQQAFTVENTIPAGLGGASTYLRYRGCEAINGTIEMDAEGIISIDFDVLGMISNDSATTALTGATYTNPGNVDPYASQADFASLALVGYTLDDLVSLKVNLAYTGRDGQPKIGGDGLVGIARGALVATLEAKAYIGTNFAVQRDLARAVTQTNFKITLSLGSITLKKYTFEFFNCFTDMAATDFTAVNGFLNLKFAATYSEAQSCVVKVTRAIA